MARSIAAKAIRYASQNDSYHTGDYEATMVDFQDAVPATPAAAVPQRIIVSKVALVGIKNLPSDSTWQIVKSNLII